MAKGHSGKTEDRTVPIESLQDNPRNSRHHPDDQITKLIASVERFGQQRRILVRKANMMIIAGHGLRQAMREAGFTDADVRIWDVDQPTADEYMLGDNEHAKGAKDDKAAIRQMIAEVDPANYLSIGFDDASAAAMLEIEDEQLVIEDIDTSEVADRFWISVRGPLDKQAAALDALKSVMGDIEGVDVELGTVAM